MDIKELQDYRLSDAIKFHTHLNPKIWGRDEHLLPEVREKLLAIAADFKEFLGLDLEVTDITISGSNAAYTYTDHSDIDLHLVADLPKADVSDIYRELFDAKKYQYNDQHNFKIGGYDVELYVQNANEDPTSQGIYSVLDNKWISVPKRRKPEVDDISVKSKYEDLGKRIEAAVKSGDAAQLEMLGKKVREFRQAGLDKTGEFGPENLAFKILRSNGTLDQLRAARLAAKDQALSIDEAKKKKKKKTFKYGFGGYYYPGYHYYGQTDAAADGGGDGGGESVKESADSVDTQLQNFVKFCADRLELEQIPRIRIKRDPAWSERNNSFGRYIPDADTLIVSIANRHPMDVMRTMAHELTHRKQDEQADMPIGAGNTGSDWENQANALAGVLMRDFAELHPEYFAKEPISEASGESNDSAIILTKLGKFHPGADALAEFVPERSTAQYALHPDKWQSTFYSLTNKDLHKLKYYGPKSISIPPGTLVGDMAIANKFYRAKSPEEKQQYAELYRQSLKPYPVDVSEYRMPELLIPRQVVAEASGYIPVNKKEAGDPRYSMAVTVDIKPGENQRQAAKMGWKTNPAGTPPTARTNGLVEALTRKLQAVKEGIGFPLVSEQDLEEVAMSPGSLKAFAASDVGQSMMAGFEAELIFSGLGGAEEMDSEWEQDYDYDERTRSIDDVIEFFSNGDFAELSTRGQNEVRSRMENDYNEWLYEKMNNDWDSEQEDFIRDYLANEEDLEGEELDERVAAAIEEQNRDYDNARESFDDDWRSNTDLDEQDWLSSEGYRYMSDLEGAYDLSWPHMRDINAGNSDEGGFNEENAQRLADELESDLGVKTTVSSGYHSARRDAETWIFEPDSSLDAEDGDMPVEIVSPPMPLGQALEILPKFFEWAKANGAYANKSTGFHMSVSMPDHGENVLDYTKLALFLGDEYVLKQFGREANTYARSAISKIRDTMGKSLSEATETRADAVLSAMRKHLNQFASRAIAQPSGFGKYTSINPKTNYIEFRSAGGSDYFADMDKIQNTLMRYARATDIAMDPAAEKQEYAKKLYKLLTNTETQQVTDPKTGRKRTEVKGKNDNDAISIFSRYVAGDLPKSELKGFLKQLQYGREVAKNPPKEKIQWKVTHPNRRATITLMASSAEEAIKLAKQEYNDTMNPDDAYRAEPVAPATQTPASDQLNAPVADDPDGNYVLRRREGSEGTGAVVYRFSAANNAAAIEAARQWTTARGLERRSVWLDHVSGVPPEVLNAPASAQSVETEPQNFPAAQQPAGEFTGTWRVVTTNGDNPGTELTRISGHASREDAERYAERYVRDAGYRADLQYEVLPVETEPQNFPAARNPEELEPQVAQNFTQTGGEFTGRWKIVSGATGEVLHTFTLRSTDQSAANRVARDWAQRTSFDDTVEVYPEMR